VRRAPHQRDRLIDVEGLGEILESPTLVSRDRAAEIRMRGHDDDRQSGACVPDLLQQIEARLARHADVSDENVRRLASQRIESGLSGLECPRRHSAVAKGALQHPADGGIVVDEPYPQ